MGIGTKRIEWNGARQQEAIGLLLRPLGAFEELFCLFDQHFPTNHALAAQVTGHTTVQQWRDALDAVQQRHPLLSACIDTTFNRVPYFRRVTSQRIPLRVVTSPNVRWQREIAEEVNATKLAASENAYTK